MSGKPPVCLGPNLAYTKFRPREKMPMPILRALPTVLLLLTPAVLTVAEDAEPLLKTLRAVGPDGVGQAEAAKAWRQLVQCEAEELPAILAGIDGANPLAANWMRTAVDAIAERQLQSGGKLPEQELECILADLKNDPRARRLAYELLVRADPNAPKRLLPRLELLDDPSLELRRDAVARLIDETAAAGDPEKTAAGYRKALSAARDVDQIQLLSQRLRKLGQEVDLPRHFGFIMRWKVIGPFDNVGEKGFDVAYPPEQKIDLQAECDGKHGKVKWTDCATSDDFGQVDLNKAVVEEKGVAAYATAEFFAAKQREVQFRMTSYNAIKLWLNGRLIDQHKVYHQGTPFDQFVSRGVLQPGRNVILVKVCQNEQQQDWARPWTFHLRVCDESGGAVLSSDGQRK
jgi:hypothetical protein